MNPPYSALPFVLYATLSSLDALERGKNQSLGFFLTVRHGRDDHTPSPSFITVCGRINNTYLPTYFNLPYFTLPYPLLSIVPYENILGMIYFWTVGFGPALLYSIYLSYRSRSAGSDAIDEP